MIISDKIYFTAKNPLIAYEDKFCTKLASGVWVGTQYKAFYWEGEQIIVLKK